MGFRICLIAATVPVERLISGLDCDVLRTEDTQPDGDDWAARVGATGWSVAWFEDLVIADVAEQFTLPELSRDADALVLRVNETSMHSSCAFWRGGRRVWRIGHRGDAGDPYDLTRLGPAPPDYAALQDAAYAAQDAASGRVDHVFDVPVRLFSARVGLRYDQEVAAGAVDQFRVIVGMQ
ncbi:hypothetical protein PARPLA_02926 [Rhodobacteraceae bacterium THAF1]|uniref:hypothetical protein n=1 Tax=Palleronia sp. THAF1 TaxID=2587842 RepID=UPI000F3C4682|nr:hypothetical protein [Palleronia sp. THAF1]QFU08327.1 hypothetical protein FIU81_06540 [Palleronia sp. THAF1]VDC28971.1 hypothetical protein PARPLA_02926 [Rhodobacteraceae bacterium THAF1]